MTRRLAFLLAAGLLCGAAPLQAQIVAWQGAVTIFSGPIGGTNGALRIAGSTTPTCTGNCGTAPAVAGNNTLFKVIIGTAPPVASNFTVTFNGTWPSAPYCHAQRATTGVNPFPTALVTTTTTVVVTMNANLVASESFQFWCVGL